ncbi:uncharacterized protein I303_104588 [Kwoniella dejecticola CBS 10117]|uniref:UBC core domain-containing protein n=1 Tax=Kwoniella dejecticola CBS 10117 TaxID=1296121 RepID=A0A1A6A4W3_9TREE|nr:uncharacterized protein I303_04435 [Kwoniella dejecticola CBS 10117]OBR85104.1 hypothetical protein I303_04435 [Kwoniella dejecticola CBS 10117]
MFSSPLRSPKPCQPIDPEISPLLAAEIAIEFNSLRTPRGCPEGIYITPSREGLLRWNGVFFVHRGPYAGSILRFTLLFPYTYPQNGPTLRFDSDVFHPLVDPKTKIWRAKGRLSSWRTRLDHVSHLLHALKRSFKSKELDSITEEEAANKQVWSLYHHSHQTFLSLTSQRSLHSASRSTLFPEEYPAPPSPTRTRKISGQSMTEELGKQAIKFKELDNEEERRLWDDLKKGLSG